MLETYVMSLAQNYVAKLGDLRSVKSGMHPTTRLEDKALALYVDIERADQQDFCISCPDCKSHPSAAEGPEPLE